MIQTLYFQHWRHLLSKRENRRFQSEEWNENKIQRHYYLKHLLNIHTVFEYKITYPVLVQIAPSVNEYMYVYNEV